MDEPLAHRIVAGADLFLMPSRYEPCGLSQLYSLRYGTVPVVHATGGLVDTVGDVDDPQSERTGFTFSPCTPEALRATLDRALTLRRDARAWRALQENGMRQDFSWARSAQTYGAEYAALLRPGAASRLSPAPSTTASSSDGVVDHPLRMLGPHASPA